MVQEFHDVFGLASQQDIVTLPPIKDQLLRLKLLKEETIEALEAMGEQDIAHIAKELADVLYVVYGAAVTYGIDLDAVFEEVHRSNMTKLHPDGTVRRREDGKILKPDTYEEANVKKILGLPE